MFFLVWKGRKVGSRASVTYEKLHAASPMHVISPEKTGFPEAEVTCAAGEIRPWAAVVVDLRTYRRYASFEESPDKRCSGIVENRTWPFFHSSLHIWSKTASSHFFGALVTPKACARLGISP